MSAFNAGLGALLSHWRRHPVQLAMLLMGLALATALWSGVQAINAEARAAYARAAAAAGPEALARLEVPGAAVPVASYVALRRAGWKVSPVVEGVLPSGVRLLGIEPLTLPAEARRVEIGGSELARVIGGEGVVFAAPETAARLGDLRVELAEVPEGLAIADIAVAMRLLGRQDLSYLVLAPQGEGAPLATIAPGLVLRPPAPAQDLSRLTESFHLNLTAFGLLAFAVGLFIVHSAIGLAFEERRAVFRTLRACGISARALTGLVLVEILVLALVAGGIGVALGYLVAAALLPDVAATLTGLYGAEVPGTLGLRPAWWASGMAIAVLGALAAAGQSLWRLWHMPVLASAQSRPWGGAAARMGRWQAAAGAALLAAALALALGAEGLWPGFAVLGGLLVGAALLLPWVLAGAVQAAGLRARGVLAQWFWADTRAQLPGLSLALMALLLALATNIGVGTMVASFRLTFTGWLDQRLASELYVTARDEAEAARMAAWLAPRVDALLPLQSVEVELFGRPGDIYGVADHATYRDNWPLLQTSPNLWDRVAAGEAVLVNEQLWRSARLGPGDMVPLAGGALPVAGVYSDYGNPRPQVLLGLAAMQQRFPAVKPLRFGLRLPPAEAPALAAALRAEFALPSDAVMDQASVKAFSLGIFERTFAVTGALNVLTLGVAALAMFASLMTLAGMRLVQLAPVWAMGLTRRRLAALEFLRTLVLAVLVLVAAVPLGLALAWVLLAVVNVAAFGWRLPMQVFPAGWLSLAGLTLLAAGAAGLLPSLRLARMAPGAMVRVFANER